jgi:imidazolonepropionase-like amidohydrolase
MHRLPLRPAFRPFASGRLAAFVVTALFTLPATLLAAGGSASGAPVAEGTVVVRADRVLDPVSGELIADGWVRVVDGRIAEVGRGAGPAGVSTLELGDRTLLPGLMDLHTHLASSIDGDWVNRPVRETAADAALRGAGNARTTLRAGFTTVRDVGSVGFVDVALAKAIAAGTIEGPRVIPVGYSLGITGGHCDTTGYAPGIAERGPEEGVADGVDEVVHAVRYQIKHGAQWIKTCATAGVLSFESSVGAQQYSQAELEAMVEEAARHGVKVAAHAHGTEGILAAVRAGVASIEHGSMLSDEVIAEMIERGTYLVPTTYLADAIDLEQLPPPVRAKAEAVLPIARESVRRAIAAGVKIAFGTDAAVYPHGLNARELGALVERGMSPLAAIQTATVNAADLLGVADRGSLAAGTLADLVAAPGNPLDDVTTLERIDFVMQGGRVVRAP